MHKLALQGVQSCLDKLLVASVGGLKGDRRLNSLCGKISQGSPWSGMKQKKGVQLQGCISERGEGMSFSTVLTTPLQGFLSSHSVLKAGVNCACTGKQALMLEDSWSRIISGNNVLKVSFYFSYPNHTAYINRTRQRLSIFAPSAEAELLINFYIISPQLSRCPQRTWKLHIWYI